MPAATAVRQSHARASIALPLLASLRVFRVSRASERASVRACVMMLAHLGHELRRESRPCRDGVLQLGEPRQSRKHDDAAAHAGAALHQSTGQPHDHLTRRAIGSGGSDG